MMITNFKLIDLGVMVLDEFLANFIDYEGFQCSEIGIGTDAESALDDLLQSLADFSDITGLEGRIKAKEWYPSSEEGDCDVTYYCIRLLFNEVE
jgi:hypothetical protein